MNVDTVNFLPLLCPSHARPLMTFHVGQAIMLRRVGLFLFAALALTVTLHGFYNSPIYVPPGTQPKRILLPRIPLNCSADNRNSPVAMQRRQFPIIVAFGMTINKSQGQTFRKVAIYLPQPVFTHGQLYVAFSRVGDPDNVMVFVPDGAREGLEGTYTKNVVYRQVFSI